MGDRDYQTRTVEELRNRIRAGKRRLLVVSPTGSGKMRVIARIMSETAAKGNRAGFAAHARELVEQNEQTLESLGTPCSIIMSGRENEHRSAAEATAALQCSVMAKDTLWARVFSKRESARKMDPPELDVLLFDEAHLSLAKTWQAIADHYKDKILIGFTATPCRGDGKGLGHLYDDMVTMATYSELQQQGFLVPLRIMAPSTPDLKGVKTRAGDYAKGELEKRMNKPKLVGDVVETWLKQSEGRDTVVFASGVDHSLQLRDQFRAAGITAEHVDGGTDLQERADIMRRCRDRSVKVLCNYGIATMGVDVPNWKCMVCCRPTQSLGLWWQMAGRVQRPFDGYTDALVLDHSSNTDRFGYPDEDVDWSLDTKTKVTVSKKQKAKVRTCKNCKAVIRQKTTTCPQCKVVLPTPMRTPVVSTKAELEAKKRNQRNRTFQRAQKQKKWDELLAWARYRGHKTAAASCRYRDYFGVWPDKAGLVGTPRNYEQGQLDADTFYREYVLPEKERLAATSRLMGGYNQ
jgi:superfamily II DNA or RNA helicase